VPGTWAVLEYLDTEGGAFPYIEFSDDQAFATLPEPSLRKSGLRDVDQAETERILPLMAKWQGTEPFMTEVAVTEDNFGSVPKTYVRASIDKIDIACPAGSHDLELGSRLRIRFGVRSLPDLIGAGRIG
jgi:hypothetical protein